MTTTASFAPTPLSRAATAPASLARGEAPIVVDVGPGPAPPPHSGQEGTNQASFSDAEDFEDEVEAAAGESNDPKIFRDGRAPRPTDVFIAVMGVTGCGKSSLISLCCDKPVQVGHDLKACTTVVDVYPFELSATQTVYLIDTPGFDDTNRSDTEVLREIAWWLTASFRCEVLLHGIIYLHRISDVRMQGSAKKNLLMFKKLCGDDALRKVILATTMWDIVDGAVAEAREKELVDTPEFWGYMVSKGSRLCRHDNTLEGARRIVQSLVGGEGDGRNGGAAANTIVLDLQEQMVTQSRPLQETAAGMELEAELERERKRWARELKEAQENMAEAIRVRDHEAEEAMRELKTDYMNRIEKLEREHRKLRTDTEQLHTERISRFKKAIRIQDTARKEGHEEQQRASAMPPYFAYSIVGRRYSFVGPWSSWWNCMSDRSIQRMNVLSGGRYALTWCGVNGSWVRKFQTAEGTWMTRYNKALIANYPALREKIRRSAAWDTEWPEWICLGAKGRFILQWNCTLTIPSPDPVDNPSSAAVITRYRIDSSVPDAAAPALQRTAQRGRLHAAALGAKGSYVFVPQDGPATYKLYGCYPGLKTYLDRQATDIEAVALNPLNNVDFIVHYRNGQMYSSVENCLPSAQFDAWWFKNLNI